MRYDRKWIFALAVIGIPGAHGLHGYVGFMFGSLKSREWWSSDLMPVDLPVLGDHLRRRAADRALRPVVPAAQDPDRSGTA